VCARGANRALLCGPSTSPLDRMFPTYPHYRFIQAYTHHGRVAALVELGLETWMVTERPEFVEFSRHLAMHVAAMDAESVDALLSQAWVRDPAITVGGALAHAAKSLGERVTITRFVRWDNEPKPPEAAPVPPRDPAVAVRLKRA
jgi:translation elongation factor EF-Ts